MFRLRLHGTVLRNHFLTELSAIAGKFVAAGEDDRYRRLHALLRREGFLANHKRLFRIYREERLMVCR
jgi:hypothetical protein